MWTLLSYCWTRLKTLKREIGWHMGCYLMSMKLFKSITKLQGKTEPYIDWYHATDLSDAKSQCDDEAKYFGLPMDYRRSVEFVECDMNTLKPV
jgi:hypothetical protein